ncbi:MAG TPA: dual specificity protein phosphatase family protein [Candidatus Acidoferrum sp.]|nr:dual specificity protein phosphatase family protein [Candidatus Acidoferrum sp.]
MNRFLFRSLLFLSLLSLPQLFAQTQNNSSTTIGPIPLGEKLKLSGLPNAGKINDSLFRGAQPQSEGFRQLKSLGITTIVDLRGEDPDKLAWERKQAESAGLHFLNIPVSGWSPPTNDQVAQFLSLFRDPHEKIFVHCRFGDDRTGVFVATYRMSHDRWPASQAIKEMYFFGFNGFWHPAMKSFISDFPEKLKTAPALAPFGNSSDK